MQACVGLCASTFGFLLCGKRKKGSMDNPNDKVVQDIAEKQFVIFN